MIRLIADLDVIGRAKADVFGSLDAEDLKIAVGRQGGWRKPEIVGRRPELAAMSPAACISGPIGERDTRARRSYRRKQQQRKTHPSGTQIGFHLRLPVQTASFPIEHFSI
jgi:hypothetical protein